MRDNLQCIVGLSEPGVCEGCTPNSRRHEQSCSGFETRTRLSEAKPSMSLGESASRGNTALNGADEGGAP